MSNVVSEIREFYRTCRNQVDRKKNLTDEMGHTLSEFVEKSELNKTAVGMCARLDRLSPEKRADVLRSIDAIREAMAGVWSQESTEEMDFEKESSGLAAAQEFERERKPGRKKKEKTPAPLVPTPSEVPESDGAAGFSEAAETSEDEDSLEFLK